MTVAEPSIHRPHISGELPDDWRWLRLDAVCAGIFDCPHSTPVLAQSGPYLARSQDIRTGIFLSEQAAHVSEETYRQRVVRAEPTYGDLLFSREGTYFGIAADAPRKANVCLGQRMVLLRPDARRVDFRYLRYWLNSPVMAAHVHGFRDGTVAERLNMPTIRALPVLTPPLFEQRAIAHILGTLDDKLDVNRRMNETLEAIARALFKSWFVDFDPVRAKEESRQTVGMDRGTAVLFPDSFEVSLAGRTPRGWGVKPLDQIARFLNGLALQRYPPDDGESLPVIKIAELRSGSTSGSDRASSKLPKEYVVEDGDLLFSWSGTLEARIWCGGRGALNQHLFKVICTEYPKWFVLRWIEEHLPEFQAIAASKATTMGHIQRHHLAEALVLVPPREALLRMDGLLAPVFDRVVSNLLESRTLAALRDTLLRKLVSGEIRVKDAEKFVRAAT